MDGVNANSIILVGALAIAMASAAVAYLLLSSNKKKITTTGSASGNNKNGDNDGVIDPPTMTKDQLLKILLEVIKQMESVMAKVAFYEQEMVKHLQAQQQSIPEDALKEHILDEFKKAMKITENQIYSSFGTTEDEVKDAAEYFAEDPDYKKIVNTLTLKFAMFAGQQPVEDLPAHVTLELILAVMTETMEEMTKAMEDTFEKCKGTYTLGSEEFNEALQGGYAACVQEIRPKILQRHGIDQVSLLSLFF
jgi:hypothetical protein